MRLSIFVQIVFLAILCLYVAVKSNDRLENSWDADKIQQTWQAYSDETDIIRLTAITKELIEKASDRLLNQLERWHTREIDHTESMEIDMSAFRNSLAHRGDDLYNQALNRCVKEGISRISGLVDVDNAHFREMDSKYKFYQRLVGLSRSERIEAGDFSRTLRVLREERQNVEKGQKYSSGI